VHGRHLQGEEGASISHREKQIRIIWLIYLNVEVKHGHTYLLRKALGDEA
jgi:hypothetical protein